MIAKPTRRLLVVLGMHRSGTSVLARAAVTLGADLGQSLMPPADGENPKGFWEDMDIYELDREMLLTMGSDWHRLAMVDEKRCLALEDGDFPRRAAALLENRTRAASMFAFKDPRVSRLLPFWKRRFAEGSYEVCYLVALRDPLAVAVSLAQRNGFDLRKGAFIWLDTMLSVLRGIRGERFVVVDYDRLLQDPFGQLRRAADALDLVLDQHAAREYVHEFLDEHLRHHLPQTDDWPVDLFPPVLREVYTCFRGLAEQADRHAFRAADADIARWSASLLDDQPSLILVDRAERATDGLRDLLS